MSNMASKPNPCAGPAKNYPTCEAGKARNWHLEAKCLDGKGDPATCATTAPVRLETYKAPAISNCQISVGSDGSIDTTNCSTGIPRTAYNCQCVAPDSKPHISLTNATAAPVLASLKVQGLDNTGTKTNETLCVLGAPGSSTASCTVGSNFIVTGTDSSQQPWAGDPYSAFIGDGWKTSTANYSIEEDGAGYLNYI